VFFGPGGSIDNHFVAFALYPRDLIHTFVLAHPACNRSKSGTLAARTHPVHWVEYVGRDDDQLNEIVAAAGIFSDRIASRSITTLGDQNALASGASG
jgi:hypothetical protein